MSYESDLANEIPMFIDHPLLERLVHLHAIGKYPEMEQAIRDSEAAVLQVIVQNLNMCECCDEHKQRKPRSYAPMPEYQSICSEPKACKCMCRHMARNICREYQDVDAADKTEG